MGSSSFHINNAKILYFRVSSINFLRPGLEAFGRDTGTRDSPTALVPCVGETGVSWHVFQKNAHKTQESLISVKITSEKVRRHLCYQFKV